MFLSFYVNQDNQTNCSLNMFLFNVIFKDQTYNLENCIVDAILFQDLEAILKIVLVKTCS